MGIPRTRPPPRPRPLSFAMHAWHQNSRLRETRGTRDFPPCSESEGGGDVGGRQEVRSPASINPGPRRLEVVPARLFTSQAVYGEDTDQREQGREGDGCPRASAERDGEAGKAASIGSICSRQDLPGWTWLPHPSSAG